MRDPCRRNKCEGEAEAMNMPHYDPTDSAGFLRGQSGRDGVQKPGYVRIPSLAGLLIAYLVSAAPATAIGACPLPTNPPQNISTLCDLQNIGFNAATLAGSYVLVNDIKAEE